VAGRSVARLSRGPSHLQSSSTHRGCISTPSPHTHITLHCRARQGSFCLSRHNHIHPQHRATLDHRNIDRRGGSHPPLVSTTSTCNSPPPHTPLHSAGGQQGHAKVHQWCSHHHNHNTCNTVRRHARVGHSSPTTRGQPPTGGHFSPKPGTQSHKTSSAVNSHQSGFRGTAKSFGFSHTVRVTPASPPTLNHRRHHVEGTHLHPHPSTAVQGPPQHTPTITPHPQATYDTPTSHTHHTTLHRHAVPSTHTSSQQPSSHQSTPSKSLSHHPPLTHIHPQCSINYFGRSQRSVISHIIFTSPPHQIPPIRIPSSISTTPTTTHKASTHIAKDAQPLTPTPSSWARVPQFRRHQESKKFT